MIWPAGFIEDSLESYLGRARGRGRPIYVATVLTVLAGIGALPVVRVEVSSQAPGTVRPVIDTHEIQAPVSAPVASVRVTDNEAVRAGDPLVELRAEAIDVQLLPVNARMRELRRLIGDLDRLLTGNELRVVSRESQLAPPPPPPVSESIVPRHRELSGGRPSPDTVGGLVTPEVGRESMQYMHETEEVAAVVGRAQARLARLERLYALQHVAFEAVESARFEVAELRARHALIREQYLARWQRTRDSYRIELRDLVARRDQLIEQRELHSIRAPITGTVGQLASLSPGSFLAAGQRLMVISPVAELVAEVYVASRDIAYIRPGMPVRIDVDAFDHDHWGVIEGRVLEVPDDVVLLDQTAVYRVRCGLGAGQLRAPDGRVGALQKGMALQARFALGRRSLLDLLRDDVRRWLDPYSASAGHAPASRHAPAGGKRSSRGPDASSSLIGWRDRTGGIASGALPRAEG